MFKPIIPTMEVTLPSNGLFDSELSKVLVRAMTGREEMHLMSSNLTNAIDKIVEACTTTSDGKSIDAKKLCAPDKLYLVLMIRSVTYGDALKINYECPHCGSKQVGTIALSELPVKYLSNDLLEELSFTLPDSKVRVKLKLLAESEIISIESEAKKISSKIGANPKEYQFILRLIRYIDELAYDDEEHGEVVLTGEPKNRAGLQSVLENITGKDITVLSNHIDKSNDFGVSLTKDDKCSNCNTPVVLAVSLTNTEFFRPTNIGQSDE